MAVNLLYKTGLSSCRRCLTRRLHLRFIACARVFSNATGIESKLDSKGRDGGGREDSPNTLEKFAYGLDQFSKKDKSAPGLFHLSTIFLPKQLEMSLKEYLKRYPRNMLENDGRKLSKHLRNRGRPTERTWKKYKESKASKKLKDLKVNLDDVMKLKKEQEKSKSILPEDDEYNLDEDEEQVENDINKNMVSDKDKLDDNNNCDEQPSGTKILNTKRPNKEEYKVVRYNKRESAAFAASRIPASYGATLKVFHEIVRREPEYKPETLMDFGSGTGTVLWAAHEKWRDYIKEYQCIDVSESMNSLSEFLLRGGESYKSPLFIPHVYYKRFLPVSNKVTYDIVIASYSLSEIPHVAHRKEAIRSLWAKTNDFLVLIEYGNNEGFEILLQARQMIEKDHSSFNDEDQRKRKAQGHQQGYEEQESPFEDDTIDEGFVFAPCPHDNHCPRSDIETRDHPCNFEQQVQLSFAEKQTSLKKWGYVTERFSYLVLRKGQRNESDKPWPRILEPIKLKRKHLICKMCSSNGELEQKILTKRKDSDIYKCVRHLSKWGDLLPMPQDRKRPLKNPEITMTRKGKPRK